MSNRSQRRKLERDLVNKSQTRHFSDEELLKQFKYVLNENQFNSIVKTIPHEKLKNIKGETLPRAYSKLRFKGNIFANDDLINELKWCAYLFLEYRNEINDFINLEDQVDSLFLLGDYSNAKLLIEKIEQTICVSHWSIEKKILIAEYESGFKKNKEVLTDIIDIENNVLTNVIAKYQSIRVEKNLSYFKYDELIDNYTNTYKDVKFKEYFYYKLNFFSRYSYNSKGFFLNVDNASSIIDKYNSFISLMVMVASELVKDKEIIEAVIFYLKKLVNNINDVRISNLLCQFGECSGISISPENKKYLQILNLYTKGEYEEVVKQIKVFLIDNANYFELYEIYNKSLINLGKVFENFFKTDSISSKSLEDIYNILNKNNKTQQSLINAHKTFNTIGLGGWSYKYFAYFNNENSYHDTKINVNKYSHLNAKYFNPISAIYFDSKESTLSFLDQIKDQSESNSLVNFWKNICSSLYKLNYNEETDLGINDFRGELYACKVLQAKAEFPEALKKYDNLQKSSKYSYENSLVHNHEDIIHGVLFCLLNNNEFEKAANLVADNNIANPNIHNKLISSYLIDKIVKADDDDLIRNISSCIVLNQYQSFVTPNDIWIAYDNYLSSHGLNYPKEIENILSEIDKEKAVYFLKNICRQEVYYSSFMFENHDELDNERIEICSILTRLDIENFEEYINEISEISRNLLIRKGIKQIDESKIYVDVKGIKKSLDKDIRESFERSMNLLNLSLDQIQKLDLNSDNVIVAYYGKSETTNKVEFNESSLKITSYSRFQQFQDMFTKIRDKFIASNEFGIDTYLSMRIRHGTLLGEIRSVFENYYLITKKEDTSNKYKENVYWSSKNIWNSPAVKNDFNQLMSDFSENIDKISEELKNKKLQIRTEKKHSDGLLDYSFEHDDLLNTFTEKIGSIDSYEDFFEEIVSMLWARTEENLTIIREEISISVKEKMVNLLSVLSQNLEAIINKNDNPEFNELVRNITSCQTDIKNKLDMISEWFKRTNSKTINEFYIALPIDATLATLKRLFKDYNKLEPKIVNNCSIKFEGENFPHFTYIMQNLLHNIIQHSKLPCEELHVEISINQIDSELSITVENNFSKTIDIKKQNEKIENTKNLLLQSHDIDKTRAEEGTGYLKIKKTLKSDLGREDFEITIFNVDESRQFKSNIIFNIDNLQKMN